jgi:hypothetical protein
MEKKYAFVKYAYCVIEPSLVGLDSLPFPLQRLLPTNDLLCPTI